MSTDVSRETGNLLASDLVRPYVKKYAVLALLALLLTSIVGVLILRSRDVRGVQLGEGPLPPLVGSYVDGHQYAVYKVKLSSGPLAHKLEMAGARRRGLFLNSAEYGQVMAENFPPNFDAAMPVLVPTTLGSDCSRKIDLLSFHAVGKVLHAKYDFHSRRHFCASASAGEAFAIFRDPGLAINELELDPLE